MDEWMDGELIYPNVLINPQTVPSAYNATVSPILRKLDSILDKRVYLGERND